MADFQSRINQFRQGLNDQQDNYNKLASNMSQMGRSLAPDKVAEHMEYVEKIGGSLTGAFAGAHATSKLYKKIQKARNARNARNQNQRGTEADGERTSKAASQREQGQREATASEGKAQGEQADRTVKETDTTRQEEEDPFKDADDPTDLGARDVIGREARGGKLGEAAKGLDEEGGGDYGAQAQSRVLNKGNKLDIEGEPDLFQSLLAPKPAAVGPSVIKTETAQGGNVNPKTDTPSRPTATAEADPVIAEKAPLEDAGSGLLSRAKDFIGKKVAGAVGEDVAGGLAEGVPILGEMVGLGMLIHGIVKAHKHEENSGGPQLTAANKEATEQSGGYSTDMLKGSVGAPSIV